MHSRLKQGHAPARHHSPAVCAPCRSPSLAGAGAAVVVAHHAEPEQAEATVARIRPGGGRALAEQADLSLVADNQRLVARAVDAFGRLDIFVANAGLTMWGPFLEVDEAT